MLPSDLTWSRAVTSACETAMSRHACCPPRFDAQNRSSRFIMLSTITLNSDEAEFQERMAPTTLL